MHFFEQTKILPYSKQELFDLVLDIESYPKFVPKCKATRVISKEQLTDKQIIIAELTVEFQGFSDKYQSRVMGCIIEPSTYIINVEAISGPFKYLRNNWRFSGEDEEETKVEFKIEFELKSFLLDGLLGLFFKQTAQQMIDAFEKRAQEKRRLLGKSE